MPDDQPDDSAVALDVCRQVRQARRVTKLRMSLYGIMVSAFLAFDLAHGFDVAAAFATILGTFLALRGAYKIRTHRPGTSAFDPKTYGWKPFVTGSFLTLAAGLEAKSWTKLESPRWLTELHLGSLHLPANWFSTPAWWLVAAALVTTATVVARRSEARLWKDYLRFNAYVKLTNDLVCMMVAHTVVVLAIPVLLCLPWADLLEMPSILALLLAVWAMYWQIDLWRLETGRLKQAAMYPQEDARGKAFDPPLQRVPSPAAFATLMGSERRCLRPTEQGGKGLPVEEAQAITAATWAEWSTAEQNASDQTRR